MKTIKTGYQLAKMLSKQMAENDVVRGIIEEFPDENKIEIGFLEIMQRPTFKMSPYYFYNEKVFKRFKDSHRTSLTNDDITIDDYMYALRVQIDTALLHNKYYDNSNMQLTAQELKITVGDLENVLGSCYYKEKIVRLLNKSNRSEEISNLAIFMEIDKNSGDTFAKKCGIFLSQNNKKNGFTLYLELLTWIRMKKPCYDIIQPQRKRLDHISAIIMVISSIAIFLVPMIEEAIDWMLDFPGGLPSNVHIILWIISGIMTFGAILFSIFKPITKLFKRKIQNDKNYLLTYKNSIIKESTIKIFLDAKNKFFIGLNSNLKNNQISTSIVLKCKNDWMDITTVNVIPLNTRISCLKLYEKNVEEIATKISSKNCGLDLQQIQNKILETIRKEYKKCGIKERDKFINFSYLFDPFNPKVNDTDWEDCNYIDDFLKGDLYCKENIDMVPSDYFFEYAIISEGGKNAKNHFLVFPERYVSEKQQGKKKKVLYKWRLRLVLRDWNLSKTDDEFKKNATLCCYSRIKCLILNEDWQKIADVGDYSKSSTLPTNDNSYFVTNCMYTITQDFFSKKGTSCLRGKIVLSDTLSDTLGDTQNFYFIINFFPKKIVRYKIEKNVFSFDNITIPKEDIVISKQNERVACLKSDMNDHESLKDVQEFNSFQRISFGEESANYEKNRVKYSLYKIIEKTDVNVKSSEKTDVNVKSSEKKRCIYCGEEHSEKSSCPNNFIEDIFSIPTNNDSTIIETKKVSSADLKTKGYTYLDSNNTETSKVINELVLPTDFYEQSTSSVVISLVGCSQSGKSTLISALFGVIGSQIGCEYIKNALKPFVEETNFYDQAKSQGGKSISKVFLQGYYSMNKYKKSIEKTSLSILTGMTHIPLIIKLSKIQNTQRKCYLSFFDAPGSDVIDEESCVPFVNYNKNYLMLFNSDCIILVVNAETTEDVSVNLAKATKVLEGIEKCNNTNLNESTLLAVVVTKFDKLVSIFDENSFIRFEPPIANTNEYEDSDLKKYIDTCSSEVESYLTSKKELSFLEKVNKYKKHKFFIVSSFGLSEATREVKSPNPEDRTCFVCDPRNIEQILFWIMFEKSIIS